MSASATIIVAGKLFKDSEMKYLPSGQPVTSFSLSATTGKKKEGEKYAPSTWFRVAIFGDRAEKMNELLREGSVVQVSGTLGIREYEFEGTTRISYEVQNPSVNILVFADKDQSSSEE